MNFFDISTNLCSSRENIFDEEVEDAYLPFMINRGMSQHEDCIMQASAMNTRSNLTKEQQYNFYHVAIQPKKKRFSKWAKPEKDKHVTVISDFFKCNLQLAEQYMKFLTSEQLQEMESSMSKGGRTR
jgi:hypothetical protein